MNQAIGVTLLQSLWQGSLIAGLLAMAFAVIRSANARYWSACVAMLAMAVCFVMTLIQRLNDGAFNMHDIRVAGLPAWRSFPGWSRAFTLEVSFMRWLAPLWMIGLCLFSIRYLAGWIGVGRLQGRGIVMPPADWQVTLKTLTRQMRLRRPVVFFESCLAETPLVLGHLRPVILMPIGLLTGLPASQVEAILAHELAHISRHDYLVNSLQRLVEALLFYHPAIWWISKQIRTERENCCDDMVVALTGDAHQYAAVLASLEETRNSSRPLALAATEGDLMQRIRRLLYPQRSQGSRASLFALIGLVVSATAVWAGRQSNKPADWLNQDVVYIINDQERAAFLKLTTDDEKQMFITQFWLRRDPTPGTPANEFKSEHYRRIAWANAHIHAAAGHAGWQSDCGHMYILYGPPDEIDSHPQDAHSTETWLYKHVDSLGENIYITFVDPGRTGEFSLLGGKPR